MQPELAHGDRFDARVECPGARLELELAVLDIERTRTRLLPLQIGEELARAVLRGDEPDRASDENREEEEVQLRHRASGSIREFGT